MNESNESENDERNMRAQLQIMKTAKQYQYIAIILFG